MKDQTKQEFIDLLKKLFSDPNFDLGELQGYLNKKLKQCKSKSNLYLTSLRELQTVILKYLSGENLHYADSDLVYKLVQDTIDTLNTPLRELEEQEAAKQKQLELEQYHKELPLKLLDLLSASDNLNIEYKVWSPNNKDIEVVLYEPYYNEIGLYRGTTEVEVKLNGEPWEYSVAEKVIQSAKEKLQEEQRKADLIAAAKAKLTKEELEILEL